MKRTAWITLRISPPYRSWAFGAGLETLGFTPRTGFPPPGAVRPEDVVVTWNLNPRYRPAAEAARAAGCPLLVAENGYIGKVGDMTPYYALARDGHNGSGFWYVGKEDRWAALGHKMTPWHYRVKGHVLIVGQRGIGSDLMKSPHNFIDTARERVDRVIKKLGLPPYPILVREHPGREGDTSAPTLAEHLAGARAVVTWASNVANLSILYGLPTMRMAPYHVNSAAFTTLEDLFTKEAEPDRLTAFRSLAWAQWSLHEIQDGTAFRSLLQDVLP